MTALAPGNVTLTTTALGKDLVSSVTIQAEDIDAATRLGKISMTVNAEGLVYTGEPLYPQVTVLDQDKLLVENQDYTLAWSDNINAGTAMVTVTGIGAYSGTKEVTFTIAKATPALTAPVAVEGLIHTGEAYQLILPGAAVGGTLKYSLSEDGFFSEAIPTAIDAGTYTVWYKVEGGANFEDSLPACIPVEIQKKTSSLTIAYVFADGSRAMDPYAETMVEGTDYTVPSPVIKGYDADKTVVSGTMGLADVVETVTYTPAIVDEVTDSGGVYTLNHQKQTATFKKPVKKTATSLKILDTVSANGQTYEVTSIAANACKGMSKLKTLTVGANITAIGKNAFNGCGKLKTITILAKNLKSVGSGAFKGINTKATVTCPKGKLNAYKKLLLKKGMTSKMTFK